MSASAPYIRSRLSGMMFLEFLLWGSWFVPISGYMMNVLRFTGGEIAWIYCTTAIGAIVSPLLVGYLADRYFATERVLAVLEILGGICLLLAAGQTHFPGLMTLMVINGLCFMPTLALCNSVALHHLDNTERFSRIAVWGTIGWIVSGLVVGFLLGGAQSEKFFYLAGGAGILLGLYSLTLPHTPPQGVEAGGDVLGLGTLKLLRDPSFLVFALCAFLISIPSSSYFAFGNAFLEENGRPKPTALMTLCQFSEILVMLILPWFISQFGLKKVLVIGMSAWAVRYVLFATNSLPFVILGLLAHGVCYCFVFVACFLYVSKRAPAHMKAGAQSLLTILTWGVGMLAGLQLSGAITDAYAPPPIAASQQTPEGAGSLERAPWPKWNDFRMPKEERQASLAKEPGDQPDSQVTLIESPQPVIAVGQLRVLGQVPKQGLMLTKKDYKGEVLKDKEGKTVEELTYARQDLVDAMQRADGNEDGIVTQPEWQAYTTHHWLPIWLWPALLAAAVAALFRYAGRDTTEPICLAEEPAPAPQAEPAAAPPADQPQASAAPAAPEVAPPSQPESIPLDEGPLPSEPTPEALSAPKAEPPAPDEPPPASPSQS